MKPLFLLTKTIAFSALLAGSISVAGDWGKSPTGKTPIEECVDLGGEISVGYESDYIFYGVLYAGDSVWTDMNHTYEGLPLPLTMGVWYLNGINGPGSGYDEFDAYLYTTLDGVAGFEVSFGYYHYVFTEYRSNVFPNGGYGEVFVDVARSLGFVDVTYGLIEATGGAGSARGWYHEIGVEKTIELSDSAGLILGSGVGYTDNYYDTVLYGSTRDSGWNHYYLKASLPIYLNGRTTLTPYVGYNGAPDTWIADGIDAGVEGPQTDILHGGVALTVIF